jgi:predicted Zn-dependent protease
MSRGLSTTAQILIPFDPLNALDLAHVRALEALRPCERLVVPMSGHKTSMFLHEDGMLKPIVLDGISAPVEVAKLRQSIRRARRSSPRYWTVLAARYKHRRRPDLALAAEKQCLDCVVASNAPDSERHEAARRYVERLIAARQGRQAIEFARDWTEKHASAYQAHDLYSRALLARGKVKTAITEARTAVGLRPHYAPLQLRLAALLAENGNLDIASRHIQAALKGAGAGGADWLNAARAFARGGDMATSRLAAQQGLAVETSNEKIIGQLRACAA